jgi:predicted HTH domain antitoxin
MLTLKGGRGWRWLPAANELGCRRIPINYGLDELREDVGALL